MRTEKESENNVPLLFQQTREISFALHAGKGKRFERQMLTLCSTAQVGIVMLDLWGGGHKIEGMKIAIEQPHSDKKKDSMTYWCISLCCILLLLNVLRVAQLLENCQADSDLTTSERPLLLALIYMSLRARRQPRLPPKPQRPPCH